MLYIIMPVHNRLEETKRIIGCLKRQINQSFHLILVDDGSADQTAEFVKDNINNLTILFGNGNLWWAGSLEKARKYLESISMAADDIVLILNNDVIFDDNFLTAVLEDMKEFPEALVLARCYDQETKEMLDGGVHVDWKKFRFNIAENQEDINTLSTRGLYLKYEVFKKIGKFHPIILPHYASDYEFTSRAQRKGFQLRASNRSKVFLNQKTTGVHDINYKNGLKYLFYNFFISKRSSKNICYWTTYIVLSCNAKYLVLNLIRVYGHAVKYYLRWMKYKFNNFLRI